MRRGVWIVVGVAAIVAVIGYLLSRPSAPPTDPVTIAPPVPALPITASATVPVVAGVPAVPITPTAPTTIADAGVASVVSDAATAAAPTARNPTLVTIDGFSLVNLAGGQPTIRPYGGRDTAPTRSISGRVVDSAGHPVAGAIVLVDESIRIVRGNIMTAGGATTDATGAFTVQRVPMGAVVALAILLDDWSDLVALGDTPATLHMLGHGQLTAAVTYDGHGEIFDLKLHTHDQRFLADFKTEPDGRASIASLPPGTYTASVGLAQAFGGGQSQTVDREITIAANRTTKLELALRAGTTVVVTAHPPPGTTPKALKFWLFSGAAPASATEARARTSAEHTPNMTHGGAMANDPIEFHDISPGTYAACVGFFDVQTMDAADRPFGCAPLVVRDDDTVRELAVTLQP